MTQGRPVRRRLAALFLALVLGLSCAGCTESGQESMNDMISGLLELSFSQSLPVSSSEWYYSYRKDMHPGNYKGEAVLDLGSPSFTLRDLSAPGLYASPVAETLGLGRVKSVTVLLSGVPDFAAPVETDPDLPGWEYNAAYPGIVPGDVYRQVQACPSDPVYKYLATRYAWVSGLEPGLRIISDYMASVPESEILYRLTAVYDGFGLLPAGFILEYQALDGGLSGCRYIYNVQPGIGFDYATGRNWIEAGGDPEPDGTDIASEGSGETGADG